MAATFTGTDDQDRLLDEAAATVKEQAFYLKRAIENNNTREALKSASNLICELRTSLLSPKNYYELYMQVFQEMQHLHGYFCDKSRHGRKMVDLYESVQHAGNILPRLYLLATVGSAYIKSEEAPAKEILMDVSELCKGVQHPLRGLFLRYYLSQMMKDKLPDTGSGYEGTGGDINDAFEFIFNNFNESNRLWVRIQHQGPAKDRAKREKERHDLRVLVGANLVRMSQLEGMTVQYYETKALPTILEHIVAVKDTMSQQYLFESMIQVFPDEFHIKTLEQLLTAYAKAHANVDMKPIVVTLMNRLAAFLSAENTEGQPALDSIDVFALFRSHLGSILERCLQPATQGSTTTPEIGPCMEIQAAFMHFTLSLYPEKIEYVDMILGSTADLVKKWCAVTGSSHVTGSGAEKVVDLLGYPLKTLSTQVLSMENTTGLLMHLDFATRKKVALHMVSIICEENQPLDTPENVQSLFEYISPLVRDDADTPEKEAQGPNFVAEQQAVAKLTHQIRSDDLDAEFAMITGMRNFFGKGGPQRLSVTLPATFHAALRLLPKIRALEVMRENGETEVTCSVTIKKVFQFLHKTVTELQKVNPEAAMTMWFLAAGATDTADKNSANPGSLGPICTEFLTQGFVCFEEEVTETTKQFQGIFLMVGTLSNITCLDDENFDLISEKITKHAGRLLKKPLMIRAVSSCSHLFWCKAKQEGKHVLACLQKCLKALQPLVENDSTQVGLWVEMLDKYIYYYEAMVEEVGLQFIQQLSDLCKAQIEEAGHSAPAEAEKARGHLKEVIKHLKACKHKPEVAARFAELTLPSV